MEAIKQGKDILGQYRLMDVLGEGASSVVYRAYRIDDPSVQVAIKFSKKISAAADVDAHTQFQFEAELLSQLQHDNIVRVLQFGVSEDRSFIVMELGRGKTLAKMLAEKHGFGILQVAQILQDIASGLAHAHNKKILHRDVKPSNVTIALGESRPKIKVFDFGLSQFREQQGQAVQVGTALYLAPELIGSRVQPDERCDLYALGMMGIELANGKHPFAGRDLRETLQMQTKTNPEIRADIPEMLKEILRLLTKKEPEQRYRTAAGVAYDLKQFLTLAEQAKIEKFPLQTHDFDSEVKPPRFLGRQQEREKFERAYLQAQEGLQVVTLSATSGSGKSRLLEEVSRRWTDSVVLWSRGRAYGQSSAYGLFAEALRELSKQSLTSEQVQGLQNSVGDFGAEIVRFAPSLKPLLGNFPDAVVLEPERRQQRFMSGMINLVSSLGTEKAPLVLILDDIQWADEGSLLLASHICEFRNKAPMLLVLSYREEDIKGNAKAVQTLQKVEALNRVDKVDLRALSENDIRALVQSMLGISIPTVSDLVAKKAQGHPLYAVELTFALVESGLLKKTDMGWKISDAEAIEKFDFADNLVHSIGSRVARLSNEDRLILSLAATIGKNFEINSLRNAFERHTKLPSSNSAKLLLEALRAAESSRLIVAGSEPGQYSFSHDKIREAFYDGLDESRKSAFHRVVMESLEQVGGDTPETIYSLAHHSAKSKDGKKAFLYTVRAGDLSRESNAHYEALEFYNQAEARINDAPPHLKIHVYESIADSCAMTGQYEKSLMNYDHVLRGQTAKEGVARVNSKIGRVLFSKGEAAAAAAALVFALEAFGEKVPRRMAAVIWRILVEVVIQAIHTLFPRQKPPSRDPIQREIGKLYAQLSYVYYFTNMIRTLRTHLRHMNYLENHNVIDEIGHAYSTHGPVAVTIPWMNRAIAYSKRSVVIRQENGDRWGVAQSRHFLTLALGTAGKWREAISTGQIAEAELEHLGDRWELVTLVVNIGYNFAYLGDWAQAERYAEKTFRISKEIQHSAGLAFAAWLRGEIGARLNLHSILKEVDDNLSVCLSAGDFFSTGQMYLARGKSLMRLGRLKEAETAFNSGVKLVEKHLLRTEYVLGLFPGLAEVLLLQAQVEKNPDIRAHLMKRAKVAILKTRVHTFGFPNYTVWSYRVRAFYQWLDGQPAKAEKIWRSGLTHSLEQGLIYQQALLLLDWALCIKPSNPEKAEGLARQAAPILKRLGAVSDLTRLQEGFGTTIVSEEVASSQSTISQSSMGNQQQSSVRRELEALMRVGLSSISAKSLGEQAKMMLDEVISLVAADRAYLLIFEEESQTLRPLAARDSQKQDIASLAGYSTSVIEQVWKTGQPRTLTADDSGEKGESESIVIQGLRSIFAIPISVQDKKIGVLYMDSTLSKSIFDAKDLEILSVIGNQIAIAFEVSRTARIESNRLALAKDLEMSAAVQSLFMPSLNSFNFEGATVAGFTRAAAQCGGDWWWHRKSENQQLDIFMGDVTGHGAGPAMITASVASMVNILSKTQKNTQLHEVLPTVSETLLEIAREEYYMSAMAVVIDLKNKKLKSWAGAAPQLVVVPKEGAAKFIGERGNPLGSRDFLLGFEELELNAGDRVVLFTDGVTEATNPLSRRQLGELGLVRILKNCQNLPALEVPAFVIDQVDLYCGTQSQADDYTIIVIDIA